MGWRLSQVLAEKVRKRCNWRVSKIRKARQWRAFSAIEGENSPKRGMLGWRHSADRACPRDSIQKLLRRSCFRPNSLRKLTGNIFQRTGKSLALTGDFERALNSGNLPANHNGCIAHRLEFSECDLTRHIFHAAVGRRHQPVRRNIFEA